MLFVFSVKQNNNSTVMSDNLHSNPEKINRYAIGCLAWGKYIVAQRYHIQV